MFLPLQQQENADFLQVVFLLPLEPGYWALTVSLTQQGHGVCKWPGDNLCTAVPRARACEYIVNLGTSEKTHSTATRRKLTP